MSHTRRYDTIREIRYLIGELRSRRDEADDRRQGAASWRPSRRSGCCTSRSAEAEKRADGITATFSALADAVEVDR